MNSSENQHKLDMVKYILFEYSQFDGSHHKAWCLDQIARVVYGNEYEQFVHDFEHVDDNGNEHEEKYYEWDIGIAP